MHNDASISDQCPMNLKVVVDSFLEEASINYVFTTDTTQMHELMLSHGLHNRNLNQNECGHALCYHIFNSLCAAIPADNDLKHSTCSDRLPETPRHKVAGPATLCGLTYLFPNVAQSMTFAVLTLQNSSLGTPAYLICFYFMTYTGLPIAHQVQCCSSPHC